MNLSCPSWSSITRFCNFYFWQTLHFSSWYLTRTAMTFTFNVYLLNPTRTDVTPYTRRHVTLWWSVCRLASCIIDLNCESYDAIREHMNWLLTGIHGIVYSISIVWICVSQNDVTRIGWRSLINDLKFISYVYVHAGRETSHVKLVFGMESNLLICPYHLHAFLYVFGCISENVWWTGYQGYQG